MKTPESDQFVILFYHTKAQSQHTPYPYHLAIYVAHFATNLIFLLLTS